MAGSAVSGFRDEARLWTWMRPRMRGKWMRIENSVEEGFFDLMGSVNQKLIFIERKVADTPNKELIEPGQLLFAKWMRGCGHDCWYAWGGRSAKVVLFTPALETPAAPFGVVVGRPVFWGG